MNALESLAFNYGSDDSDDSSEPPSKKQKINKKPNKKQAQEIQKANHQMILRTCKGTCKKSCSEITEEIQKEIWNRFWQQNYNDRKVWLMKMVSFMQVKRHLTGSMSQKSESRSYVLPVEHNVQISVCQSTFLQTLGYRNNSLIMPLSNSNKKLQNGLSIRDSRGQQEKPIVDISFVKEHIESFKPIQSHYKRAHAPNIRYLPRELTGADMFKDFCSKYPGVCLSTRYYEVRFIMKSSIYKKF